MSDTRSPVAEGELFALYERMVLIRRTEERLRDEAKAGNLPGAVHLYIGEEAVATGVCAHLNERDLITSTHRGHGHFLAKGGDLNAMMAEIWAKDTGICRGMGGSMHVADFSKGILGANGIVGAGFAIATGAAYSAMLAREGRVVVDFFGDGASNQGTLMECHAVLKELRGLPPGMDPLEAGQRVLRGVRNNDLYILTSPEFEQELQRRSEAIIASLPTDVNVPEGRVIMGRALLGKTVYAAERDRRRKRVGAQPD